MSSKGCFVCQEKKFIDVYFSAMKKAFETISLQTSIKLHTCQILNVSEYFLFFFDSPSGFIIVVHSFVAYLKYKTLFEVCL